MARPDGFHSLSGAQRRHYSGRRNREDNYQVHRDFSHSSRISREHQRRTSASGLTHSTVQRLGFRRPRRDRRDLHRPSCYSGDSYRPSYSSASRSSSHFSGPCRQPHSRHLSRDDVSWSRRRSSSESCGATAIVGGSWKEGMQRMFAGDVVDGSPEYLVPQVDGDRQQLQDQRQSETSQPTLSNIGIDNVSGVQDKHSKVVFHPLNSPAPAPSQDYLRKSGAPSHELLEPSRLLVILDLNGTLLYRRKKRGHQMSASPILRPGISEFLKYLHENFYVMVWSSVMPENAELMIKAVFTPAQKNDLLAVWDRTTLGLSKAQYREKVQVYKVLDRVWCGEHAVPNPGDSSQPFNQTNTVLIDDSATKAWANPYNHMSIPKFVGTREEIKSDAALFGCMNYLEKLRWQSNVSAFIKHSPPVLTLSSSS